MRAQLAACFIKARCMHHQNYLYLRALLFYEALEMTPADAEAIYNAGYLLYGNIVVLLIVSCVLFGAKFFLLSS
jgi:hypothetical protein